LELFERFSPVERQEAYLMLGGKYLVGCTRKRDSRYKEFMEKIKEEMQSDKIATTKTAAVKRFGELLSAAPCWTRMDLGKKMLNMCLTTTCQRRVEV
jgi:hypothetical protein